MYYYFKTLVLLFALLLLRHDLNADEVRISGKISNGDGHNVRLITYTDYISKLETVLGSAIVADDGSYDLQVNIDKISFAFIEVGLQRGEIYLIPGHAYSVDFEIDKEIYHFSLSKSENLILEITDAKAPDLNGMIQEFNSTYNELMVSRFYSSYSRITKAKVKELTDSVNSKYTSVSEPYLKDYIRYRLAILELSSRTKSRESIAREYLTKQPILLNNVEYMEFFNQFFSHFLITSPNMLSSVELKEMVNDGESYLPLANALKKFPYLSEANAICFPSLLQIA